MRDSTVSEYTIRPAMAGDVAEIARLFTTLGHPTTAEEAAGRWDSFVAAGNTALVAAKADGTLAGVATLSRMAVLHRPRPVGRISTMVVDAPLRGNGIGRALVAAAEKELARAGCGLIEITSNLRRVDAHAFYQHLGYRRTSIRVAKELTPAG